MHFCWDPPTETRVHWEKKGGKCMGEGHKKLNFSDCMGLAIGQIIGSGIMVLTGIVIGLTGHGIAVYFRCRACRYHLCTVHHPDVRNPVIRRRLYLHPTIDG